MADDWRATPPHWPPHRPTDTPFVRLCRVTWQHNWCWNLFCGTCGAAQLRTALRLTAEGHDPYTFDRGLRNAPQLGTAARWSVTSQEVLLDQIAQSPVHVLATTTGGADWLGYLGIALSMTTDARDALARLTTRFMEQVEPLLGEQREQPVIRDLLRGRQLLAWEHLELFERIEFSRTMVRLIERDGRMLQVGVDGLDLIEIQEPRAAASLTGEPDGLSGDVRRVIGLRALGPEPYELDLGGGRRRLYAPSPRGVPLHRLVWRNGSPTVFATLPGAGSVRVRAVLSTDSVGNRVSRRLVDGLSPVPNHESSLGDAFDLDVAFGRQRLRVRCSAVDEDETDHQESREEGSVVLGLQFFREHRVWVDVLRSLLAIVPNESRPSRDNFHS